MYLKNAGSLANKSWLHTDVPKRNDVLLASSADYLVMFLLIASSSVNSIGSDREFNSSR